MRIYQSLFHCWLILGSHLVAFCVLSTGLAPACSAEEQIVHWAASCSWWGSKACSSVKKLTDFFTYVQESRGMAWRQRAQDGSWSFSAVLITMCTVHWSQMLYCASCTLSVTVEVGSFAALQSHSPCVQKRLTISCYLGWSPWLLLLPQFPLPTLSTISSFEKKVFSP